MSEIMPWVNAILLLVIAYLLSRRDRKQEEEMQALKVACTDQITALKVEYSQDFTNLYTLHHTNEAKLSAYQLKIAENHYPKPELDQRFMQLDTTIKDGFKELGSDFKDLTRVLHNHMNAAHSDKSGGN